MSNSKADKFISMLKADEPLAYDVETGGHTPGDGGLTTTCQYYQIRQNRLFHT